MHRGLSVLRIALVAVLGFCIWNAGAAKAADIEVLMVPSAAMGRDIPVAFLAGGPHAAYLLDGFNAGPDVSNWVTAGNGFNTLAGKGISVIAPAGGAYSMYTNWEQDGSKQWETFLSAELPEWLAANKGLAPGGHAVVGAAQGGYGALALAAFHPDRFSFAGSMSGFVYPSETAFGGAILGGLQHFGGVDGNAMWGAPQLGRWKWHDPYMHAALLAQNDTRIWIFSPKTLTAGDPASMLGVADQAQGINQMFYAQYRSIGGHNGHFDLPASGDHGWSTWGPELGAMSGDIAGAIR
jgi:S-formylglutathione hydrolase FrmB